MKKSKQDAPGSARPSGTVGTDPAGSVLTQEDVLHFFQCAIDPNGHIGYNTRQFKKTNQACQKRRYHFQ